MQNEHLTFQESKEAVPVAFIDGGRYDGEVVFVSEQPDKADGKRRPQEGQVNLEPMLRGLGLKPRERAQVAVRLQKAMRFGHPPEEDILDLYHKVKAKTDMGRSITLVDGTMMPVPDPEKRGVTFVFGAAGSGKSVFVRDQIIRFKNLFPKATVYLFSRKNEDPSLDDIKPKRILIDDAIGDEHINCDAFDPGSAIVFDDVDSLPKKQMEAVHAILKDVLNVGRQRRLYTWVTSHLGSDYKRTREILNECQQIVFFPNGSSTYAIKYVLERYAGMDKQQIKKVLKLPSRWVSVRTHLPRVCVYQSGCFLLSGSDD
jgi:hypothetical protein